MITNDMGGLRGDLQSLSRSIILGSRYCLHPAWKWAVQGSEGETAVRNLHNGPSAAGETSHPRRQARPVREDTPPPRTRPVPPTADFEGRLDVGGERRQGRKPIGKVETLDPSSTIGISVLVNNLGSAFEDLWRDETTV
eukprot:2334056-Pyramimonas_sp.AAC.1